MPVLKISKRHPESEATLSRVEFGIEKTQFSKNNPGQTYLNETLEIAQTPWTP